MEYYLFKAKSEVLDIEREYIYNLAIGEKDSIYIPMMEVVRKCIAMDLRKDKLELKTFKLTRSIVKSKYINRNIGKFKLIEPVDAISVKYHVPKSVDENGYDKVLFTPIGFYRDRVNLKTREKDGEVLPVNSKWRDIPSRD